MLFHSQEQSLPRAVGAGPAFAPDNLLMSRVSSRNRGVLAESAGPIERYTSSEIDTGGPFPNVASRAVRGYALPRAMIRPLHAAMYLASSVRSFLIATLLLILGNGLANAASDEVSLNFVNADIEAVVKAVSEITGRNFIIDPRVKGTINVISSRPIPRDQVYPTMLSALRLQGYAAVEGPNVIKIVPEADAKTGVTAIGVGRVGPGGDRLVTQVVPLRYESAAQVVAALRPLITQNNTIAALPNSNTVIITDYADNIKRLDRIIDSIEQSSAGEPVVVAVKHASAVDLVQTLNKLLGEGTSGQPGLENVQRVLLVADARSNSIIARSDSSTRLSRVKALIEQLDTPTSAEGNIHILYLRNAEASLVAQTLRASLTGEGGNAGSSPALPNISQTSSNNPLNPMPVAISAPSTSPNVFSIGGITIQADAASNALIVAAPDAIYNNIRAVVEKLDVRRAQVFVEALVVEVEADTAASFGVQWQVLSGINNGNTQGIGGTNFGTRGTGANIIDVAQNLGTVGAGLNIGVVKGTISLPGLGTIANLGVLASALATNSNANILSTPNLLTLDNEEARIVVGQNVPFITGQYAQTGTQTTPTPFQTIERQDVGLTLRVRPHITEGGTVRMEIHQEVSSVQDTTNAAGVITNKRALDSTVLVDDGQLVVLGGLIQDHLNVSQDRVPVMGNLPVIGALFRHETRSHTKTNLMVFLRPHVIRSSTGGSALTADRYDYLIGEQIRTQPDSRVMLPDMATPILPPLSPKDFLPSENAPAPAAALPAWPAH